jgi:hypothetical protein
MGGHWLQGCMAMAIGYMAISYMAMVIDYNVH